MVKTISCFAVAAFVVACNGGGSGAGNGGSGGSTDNATGTLTGAITGTVGPTSVFFNTDNTGATSTMLAVFSLNAVYDSSDSSDDTLSITSAGGWSQASLVGGPGLPALPTVGTTYTESTPGACGGVSLSGGNAAGTATFGYEMQLATDCGGAAQTPGGTFTLEVTSTPDFSAGGAGTIIGADDTAHGTLTATMPGSMGMLGSQGVDGTVTLSLTF
jgi:hypothetical protein